MGKFLLNKPGEKLILLGNEAIVRGALEAGVQFVSTYPGTPASEIGNTFSQIAKDAGVYFEFSTNEKVALEAGAGASFSGQRVLVAMKDFGLNVASDFLIPLCYSGVKGGMVILVADDPSCWSSAQSEQNTRAFAYLAHIPILEPSTPQECKDFIKLGFELSEKFEIPILIRTTTRVSHQSAPVVLDKIIKRNKKAEFVKNPRKFSTMPPRVLEMKQELLDKIEKIREFSEKSSLNQIARGQTSGRLGIITSGVSYLYVKEAMEELNINLPVLKLGFFHPLPEKKIQKFIKNLKKVLVVEELEPFLEKEIKILAKDTNPCLPAGRQNLQISGKSHLSQIGELRPEQVISAVSKFSGKKTNFDFARHRQEFSNLKITKRYPQFCPGCPYWFVFPTLRRIVPKDTIFGGEIGCYMLAAYPPHRLQDYLYCMGSSVGIAHGIKKSTKQKLITFVGDSSFFHASIPALINAVFNKSSPLIIILDNRTTAMTGHQPNPGVGKTGMGDTAPEIKIEDIVRACGVKNLKVVDQQNVKEFEETVKDFLEKEEVSVIIARHPCKFVK